MLLCRIKLSSLLFSMKSYGRHERLFFRRREATFPGWRIVRQAGDEIGDADAARAVDPQAGAEAIGVA